MKKILKCTGSQYQRNLGLVELYFKAWDVHDSDIIDKIFSPTARYIIRRKKYKILKGKQEIINYWKRNGKRQKDIKVVYTIRLIFGDRVYVFFSASFFDLEENYAQRIVGKIEFRISNNLISQLKETYHKYVDL